ncbi:MAG: PP2C family protein-serine/threonine phosphatase [Terriglobales bacterium]
MDWRKNRRRRTGFWQRLPASAFATFLAGVFFLFASFGFIGLIGQAAPWTTALGGGIYTGIIGVGFAWLGTREEYVGLIIWALAVCIGFPTLRDQIWPPAVSPTPAASLDFAAIAAMVAVVAGYVLFLLFVQTEGRRHFRLEAEIKLAEEIHHSLAPPIERRLGSFEFRGSSRASGNVGGDLLDVVEAEGGWLAYIADVSGHGVAAGVLMAGVKSAVHTWLAARGGHEEGILPGLNRVLTELLPEESFVTLAAILPAPDGGLQYAAAGHPPLLHFHASSGEVTQHGAENFPLGLFADATFASVPIQGEEGDVLAIFTDGLVEIFGQQHGEFGLEGITAALRQTARQPLEKTVGAITEAARAFGPQTDDQTLLLVRFSPAATTVEAPAPEVLLARGRQQ